MTRGAALREMTRQAGTQSDRVAVRALLSVSAPRLRGAIGPWAWLAQLPITSTAPSLAGVTTVAGQAAAGAGVVGISTAVGLTALTPHHVPGEVAPQVLPGLVLQHSPSPTPTSSASARPTRTRKPDRAVTVGSTSLPVAPSRIAAAVPSRSPTPSPTARDREATRKTPHASPAATAAVLPSPSLS